MALTNNFETLSQMALFRLFQTERDADHNFKFEENDIKISKWVENSDGKGEIEQCFQKSSSADT